MNTQLPNCIPATLHCTPIEPCPTINPPCPGGQQAQGQTAATVCTQYGCHTHVYATNCLPATVCAQTAEAVGWNGIEGVIRPDLPWPCGLAQAGETPNLLLGLAGIGYFYLRLYDSAAVPSVLLVRAEDGGPRPSSTLPLPPFRRACSRRR